MTPSNTISSDRNPEWSRPQRVDRLPPGALEKSIQATTEECLAIARRLGLEAVHRLSADLTVKLTAATGIIRVTGSFDARIRQNCVVTLDPFDAELSESIDVSFAAVPADLDVDVVDIDPLSEDEAEPLEGNILDLGEIVTQHVSLALDPYPRMPGAEIPPLSAGSDEAPNPAEEKPNPFAALAKLKRQKG